MFDHLGFGVSNLSASRSFFVAVLAPLGIGVVKENEYGVGLGKNGKPALWLSPVDAKPSALHLAFTAETRADVDAFHRHALGTGGKDNGAPGLRPHYHANYYGAFVISRMVTISRLSATRPRPEGARMLSNLPVYTLIHVLLSVVGIDHQAGNGPGPVLRGT